MNLIKHEKNIHELRVDGSSFRMGMFSDIHWDNPKCDWNLLKHDLDYCLKNEIPIMFNGDTFCLMQGAYDPRKMKGDIRPEHNNARYFDSIIETAVDFFLPYANLLTVVGYGNHETSIIKRQETDVIQRFVTLLNYKAGSNVMTGGYGGWLIVNQLVKAKSNITQATKIKYFHGSGGGGLVTKGALNLTRAMEMYEGYDVFTMGHIHENSARNDVRDSINFHPSKGYYFNHKQIHSMITGTYKEEYIDGLYGWHVERGAPMKPVGGRLLTIECGRDRSENKDILVRNIDSMKFPL
jgi:hypothetical protein